LNRIICSKLLKAKDPERFAWPNGREKIAKLG
jgi:hypothetical protein